MIGKHCMVHWDKHTHIHCPPTYKVKGHFIHVSLYIVILQESEFCMYDLVHVCRGSVG